MLKSSLSALWVLALASCGLQPLDDAATAPTPIQAKPRWLALHAPALGPGLAALARHRRAQGYEVILRPVGAGDPDTLRRHLSPLFENPRVGDVALIVGSSGPGRDVNSSCIVRGATGTRGDMRGMPSDAILALHPESGTPVITLGRLPAGNPGELREMIRRIIAFEGRPGESADGRFSVIVGNPMGSGESSRIADAFVSSQSRRMLGKVHSHWSVQGSAEVRGHPFEAHPSEFLSRAGHAYRSPYEVLAFFGHADTPGAASTKGWILTEADWNSLQDPLARGIFFTCGCYAMAGPDAHGTRSIRARHGPVAAIGATGTSYAAIGALAGRGLADGLSGPEGPATIGDWWRLIQRGIASGPMGPVEFLIFDRADGSKGSESLRSQRLEHLEMWQLLGDPATRLPHGSPS